MAAFDDNFPPFPCGVRQLASPFSVALQRALELARSHRVFCVEEFVGGATNRLLFGKAIELFCASIPVHDCSSGKLPDQDRVVRLLQQVRLLLQRLCGLRALNGDTRKMGDLPYDIRILRRGASWLAMVNREGSQYFSC